MKKIFIIFIGTLTLTACSKNAPTDKKAALDGLKKEQAALQDKINALESEISAGNKDLNSGSKEIMITEAVPKPFLHYIDVQAKVDGDENVAISPEMGGTITSVNVHSGQQVSKGTILAEMDAASTLKAIEETQSQVDFTNTLYMKQKSLWDQKVGSEVQFLTAKNNYESGKKRLATLREQLAMSKIKSPINGNVDGVEIKVGQTVMPGMAAFHVVNLTNLKVKGEVAESYVSKVKKGNEVLVYFPDVGKELSSTISYSGNIIDPLNRTFKVEVALPSKSLDLHPNMVASLKIVDYKSSYAFTVPINLVQTGDEGQYLYLADGEQGKAKAKKCLVKTGQSYNGYIEIKSGIKEGDKIITTGYQDLVEGQPLSF